MFKTVALVGCNVEPQGIPLIDPEAVTKTSQQDLVALATEIQKADNFIQANACSKLQLITEQIRFLKEQAKDILIEADWNMKLHHAACNFVKHPGHVYHLYQRETGQLYFSMLSPQVNYIQFFHLMLRYRKVYNVVNVTSQEWGNSGPLQVYKGSYRLERDHSWTPLQKTDEKNKEMAVVAKLLSSLPTTTSAFKSIDLNLNT